MHCRMISSVQKFNWVNFKDPTSFIQQFINQAASNLTDRKELQNLYKMKEKEHKEAKQEDHTWQKQWIGYLPGSTQEIT